MASVHPRTLNNYFTRRRSKRELPSVEEVTDKEKKSREKLDGRCISQNMLKIKTNCSGEINRKVAKEHGLLRHFVTVLKKELFKGLILIWNIRC